MHRQRVQRLLRTMGLEASSPRPHLSQGGADQRVSPDRLRGVMLHRPHPVWRADIPSVPRRQGLMYRKRSGGRGEKYLSGDTHVA